MYLKLVQSAGRLPDWLTVKWTDVRAYPAKTSCWPSVTSFELTYEHRVDMQMLQTFTAPSQSSDDESLNEGLPQ
jgi:hypothetical protein